jgi:hypothetical protein
MGPLVLKVQLGLKVSLVILVETARQVKQVFPAKRDTPERRVNRDQQGNMVQLEVLAPKVRLDLKVLQDMEFRVPQVLQV